LEWRLLIRSRKSLLFGIGLASESWHIKGTLGKETDQANDPELAKALWELSEKFVRDRVGEDALLAWDDVKTT